MSTSNEILYPPEEILNPAFGKNFEYIILWMLDKNEYCTWSNFSEEISPSTLSGKLNLLLGEGYVEKVERNHYKITPSGRERFIELATPREKKIKLRFPPKIILRERNYDHWILWMLNNNLFCKWSDFKDDPLTINSSSLSKNLNLLIDKELVINENKAYKATPSGKTEYFKMLKLYDLDRQSILDEESRRIEEITKKTIIFFENFDIEDDSIKFRFLNNILKLNYEVVEDRLKDEEEFYKILLYLSINHPSQFPDFISIEDFSFKYDIEKRILEYYIYEIAENDKNPLYSIKFFKLEGAEGSTYYFHKDDPLEKMLNVIVEKNITKFTYLNKLYEGISEDYTPVQINTILDEILDNICTNIFDEGLKDSLRSFLPNYLKYLAYKIETEQKLVSQTAKMEGVAWQNFYNQFQAFNGSTGLIHNGGGEAYYILDHRIFDVLDPYYLSKFNFVRDKDFENDYFSTKNLSKIRKVVEFLNRGKIKKAENLFITISEGLNEIENLIIKDLIATSQIDFEKSIKLTTTLIAKYPDNYVGFLLQSLTYFGMNELEKSLEVTEEGLKVTNNTFLVCQKAQLYIKKIEYGDSSKIIDDSLSENPNNVYLLRLKSILYFINPEFCGNDPEEPMNILNYAIKLKPDDLDLLILKAGFLCVQAKYKEAKNFLFKEIGFNVFTKNPRIDTAAFFILAYSYIARGRFEKALKRANQVLIHYENHPLSYLTKAMVLGYNILYKYDLQELDEERFTELIDIAIKLESNKFKKARYFELKSRIIQEIEGLQEALTVIDTAINLDTYNLSLYDTKFRLLVTNHQEEDALGLLDKIFENKPTLNKEYYNAKSFLLFKLNRYKESLEAIDNVIDLFPNDTSLLNNRTVMLAHFAKILKENEKKEDYQKAKEKAIATAEKLISLAPKVGNFYDSYGEMLMMFEEYEDAIEQFKKALTLEPHGWFTFDTYSKMGKCYKGLDEIEKAIESYEKAKLLSERMLPERRTGYISKTINFEKEIKNLKWLLKEKSKNKTA